MVDIETVSVRLGERDFVIRQAGYIRSKPWKQRMMTDIKPLFERLSGAGDIRFDTPGDMLQLLPLAEELFIAGIETIYELLVAYSPELEAEREYIANYATDKQIFTAFQEVVKLADFFGIVSQLNRRIGSKTIGT